MGEHGRGGDATTPPCQVAARDVDEAERQKRVDHGQVRATAGRSARRRLRPCRGDHDRGERRRRNFDGKGPFLPSEMCRERRRARVSAPPVCSAETSVPFARTSTRKSLRVAKSPLGSPLSLQTGRVACVCRVSLKVFVIVHEDPMTQAGNTGSGWRVTAWHSRRQISEKFGHRLRSYGVLVTRKRPIWGFRDVKKLTTFKSIACSGRHRRSPRWATPSVASRSSCSGTS